MLAVDVGVLDDPRPLFVVDHPPLTRLEHPPVAAVDDDQPDGTELAEVAEAVAAGRTAALLGLRCPLPQRRRWRRRSSTKRSSIPSARISAGDRLPRCWYTQYDINPPSTCSFHHGCRRMSSSHDDDVFQSSIMSWSSKIIALGTTESIQRSTSGSHASW